MAPIAGIGEFQSVIMFLYVNGNHCRQLQAHGFKSFIFHYLFSLVGAFVVIIVAVVVACLEHLFA